MGAIVKSEVRIEALPLGELSPKVTERVFISVFGISRIKKLSDSLVPPCEVQVAKERLHACGGSVLRNGCGLWGV